MSKSKEDKSLSFGEDQIYIQIHPMNITKDYANEVGAYLSIKDTASLVCTNRRNYAFYKPVLDKKKATEEALTYVVEGNPNALKELINIDYSLLFEKYQIKAPRGQIYLNVSPFQAIKFLCDDDMNGQIMPLIPERFNAIRQEQYAEIDCGGADLIKLDRDPQEIILKKGFEGLTHYKKRYTLFDNTQQEVTFPLLENPDGIICYQDEQGEKHFYYANKEKETIVSLDDRIISEESEVAFEQFKASFDGMENNSGRRSSEKEYQLITSVLKCTLVRKGIFYKDNDILYRDSRTPFNLVNAYRQCIRLYEEAENNNRWDTAHQSWRGKVGTAQGEEIWLLQRLCEENRPFYPLNKNHKDFKRGFMIYNYSTQKDESVFEKGVIKISDFAIYKTGDARGGRGMGGGAGARSDLVAICWHIEEAKANVVEFKPMQEAQMNCTIR
ncbi:TPA: hypothetical protein ACP9DH_002893 [Legionella anisa]